MFLRRKPKHEPESLKPAESSQPAESSPQQVEPAVEPEVEPAVDLGPAGDLTQGLERSRGGFMDRLRGLLRSGPANADWDEVEEVLIGGDVGEALAMDVDEKARAR